jgi:hypothetical protein
MVVIETAVIGAAGYGLYKGGEAGVRKGHECQREFQRERKRSSLRSSLREKTNTRSSRIAEIVKLKENGGAASGLARFGISMPATAASPTRASFAERQLAEKEASSDVDDRHRQVMQKLRSGRQEERKKGSKKGFNLFKKK